MTQQYLVRPYKVSLYQNTVQHSLLSTCSVFLMSVSFKFIKLKNKNKYNYTILNQIQLTVPMFSNNFQFKKNLLITNSLDKTGVDLGRLQGLF